MKNKRLNGILVKVNKNKLERKLKENGELIYANYNVWSIFSFYDIIITDSKLSFKLNFNNKKYFLNS